MDRYGDIVAFVRVVDAGGFTAAAKALEVSPSTISKQIARLETRLGARLLSRTSRVIGLTEEGRRFYERGVRAIEALAQAEESVQSERSKPTGVLRVHAGPAFSQHILLPLVPAFLRRHPSMSIELKVGLERLDAIPDDVDITFQDGSLSDTSFVARRIGTTSWSVCASPDYLDRHGAPAVPADLERHNCLAFASRLDWNTWKFSQAGHETKVVVRGNASSNHADTLKDLACAGVGIVRLGAFQLAGDIQAGRLVPLLTDFAPGHQDPFFVIYRSKRNISPRIRAFLDYLDEGHRQDVRAIRPLLDVMSSEL